MDGGPFIIVSDIHLGSDDSCATPFAHFCDWLEALESTDCEGIPIVDEPEGRRIRAPQSLILLGDIVELWAPRSGDHTAALRDSFTIFDKLLALSCDKVYVLGNHDEELSDYHSYTKREDNQVPSFAPQDYVCKNGSLLLVVNGQYPNFHQQYHNRRNYTKKKKEVASKEWKQAGDIKYIFLHGHQFDKMFRRVGPLRHFPGLVAGLASFLDSHIGKGTGPVSLIIFFILAILTATNWMNVLVVIGQLLPVWWIVTGVFGIAGFSWLWTKLQKPAWKYLFKNFADRPRYKDVGTIIDENYYDCKKDFTLSESVIVFGHTHVPDIAMVPKHSTKAYWKKCDNGSGKKTFINSGAWVRPSDQEGGVEVTPNTLVYIDADGPLLLKWDDVKREVLYYVPASRGKYSVLKTL